jgi:hypothetical protein
MDNKKFTVGIENFSNAAITAERFYVDDRDYLVFVKDQHEVAKFRDWVFVIDNSVVTPAE